MSNIVGVRGFSERELEMKIGDMRPGDQGYTVEWAIRDGNLNEEYVVWQHKGGTANMLVKCVGMGKYEVEYNNA